MQWVRAPRWRFEFARIRYAWRTLGSRAVGSRNDGAIRVDPGSERKADVVTQWHAAPRGFLGVPGKPSVPEVAQRIERPAFYTRCTSYARGMGQEMRVQIPPPLTFRVSG